MNATEAVLVVLRVEAVALLAAALGVLGVALTSRYARRRRQARLARGRAIIAVHLEDLTLSRAELDALRQLRRSDISRLLFEIAPNVGDRERAWLRSLAVDLGIFATAQRQARSRQWWQRLAGLRMLTLLGGADDVARRAFTDCNASVRAQAASYVAQWPSDAGIDALMSMLVDRAALCRFAAKDALIRLGRQSIPAVRGRLAQARDASTVPLLEVACGIATHELISAADIHMHDDRAEARALAARLLRGIGGPDAVARLAQLLGDSSPDVRETAAEGIGYLNHWPAAFKVGRLLDDGHSRVRLAAAVALRHMGPPGELLLRRAAARGSAVAAVAARRVLEEAAG